MNGTVAVALRGTCSFATKAWQAQQAGAIALVVVDTKPGTLIMHAMDSEQVPLRMHSP